MVSVEEISYKLRSLFEEAVKRNLGEGILLSGGLDTSLIALVASKHVSSLNAFTVGFKEGKAPDVEFAKKMANYLKLKQHLIHYFDEEEAIKAIKDVVRIMRSFDPMEVRNSVTILIGLKKAKENGISTIMTGDGADELLAGYTILFNLEKEELEEKLKKLWRWMHFSSVDLGKSLGIEVKIPFLDPEFKTFAMEIDPSLKIRKERGETHGKWILRKAFEGSLPDELIWRVKTPIEFGSGSTFLTEKLSIKIPDEEFSEKKQKYLEEDKVTIRDKEHFFYYETYRSLFGPPKPDDPKKKTCSYCQANVSEKSDFCKTCGAYPV
ncbi:MAG: asparagine synthase C-terminal domain-containing protein [Candidatus Hodarchaeota archaeon]